MITGVICSYHDEDSSSELSQAVLKSSSSRHGWLQQIPVCRAESSKPSLRVNTTGLAPQLHRWFPIPWLPGHTHSPPRLCRHWPSLNAKRQRLVEKKKNSTERRGRQGRVRSSFFPLKTPPTSVKPRTLTTPFKTLPASEARPYRTMSTLVELREPSRGPYCLLAPTCVASTNGAAPTIAASPSPVLQQLSIRCTRHSCGNPPPAT